MNISPSIVILFSKANAKKIKSDLSLDKYHMKVKPIKKEKDVYDLIELATNSS